jgi:hypothetical protein
VSIKSRERILATVHLTDIGERVSERKEEEQARGRKKDIGLIKHSFIFLSSSPSSKG